MWLQNILPAQFRGTEKATIYPSLHLNFNFAFYQKTIIGIMPVGKVRIPLNFTVTAFKNY